jgi:hypothetical protein
MKRKWIDSRSLRSVGYDADRKVLEAEFVNDGVYQYLRVPGAMYTALMTAESKGAFFNRRIRDRYVCRKIQ